MLVVGLVCVETYEKVFLFNINFLPTLSYCLCLKFNFFIISLVFLTKLLPENLRVTMKKKSTENNCREPENCIAMT